VALPWGETNAWDLGAGAPVVVLHGICGGRRLLFRVAPLLAERRRVVVPPLRGEDRPAPRATWEELLGDLSALLSQLDLRDVTLLGLSFGGALALAYGARRDPRVRAIVVQGAFARFRLRLPDRVAQLASRLVPARVGAAWFARRVRRGPEGRLLARHVPGLEHLLPAWSARTPFATLRRRVRLITTMDLAPALAAIDVPLTFARGEEDKVVPRAFFKHLCALRPDARRVTWPDVGHNACLTHPALLAATVP